MERLDNYLAKIKNLSRTRAQELIKNEKVLVDGKSITKPSFLVDNAIVEIKEEENYVSRGAYKLKKALEAFDVSVKDKVVLDMGASTGGFTQVALEFGAKKVYSVDVGKGELDKNLAIHPCVCNIEGMDIRNLTKDMVGDSQIVVGDLSFISLKHILPKINALLGKIECVLLFKPQFECGKELAKKFRGVIKDKSVHKRLLKEFITELEVNNFVLCDLTYSPIKGKSGNIEYLLHLNGKQEKIVNIDKVVDQAFENTK